MDQPDIRAGRLRPEDYAASFDDLKPPLTQPQALVEASRCYFCFDAPCIEACPTSIDIPSFIRKIQTGNLRGSAMDILDANIMGGTCARVCPTEVLCEEACVRMTQEAKPVRIGLLQRHATDWLYERGIQPFARAPSTGRRVAVVGAGPTGLACAHALARHGHDVVVLERRDKAGGLNEYGIAAYKMVQDFAKREVDFILGIGGIEVRTGIELGRDVRLEDLRRDYDAVFLAIGLAGVNALGLDGEGLQGVEDAVAYIERLRQTPDKSTLPVGRDVVVIGGGNTAIDIAVQTKRLGAENVTIAYRRGPRHMSATWHEQEVAKLDGVKIKYWSRPVRLIGRNGHVAGVELEYTQEDGQGRLTSAGERLVLRADQVFKAIGQKLVPSALDGAADILELERGKIAVNDERRTSLERVWAGGDCTDGDDLTVVAVEHGKIAAEAIHRHLAG